MTQFVPWTLAALIEDRRVEPRDVVVVAPNVIDLAGADGEPDAVHDSPAL